MTVRMRHTRGQTGSRRSHHNLEEARFSTCASCGKQYVRHTMCQHCGVYRGRTVVDMKAKEAKLVARKANKLKARGQNPSKAETSTE